MAGVVYFGNKDKQSWIKAPGTGMQASNVGWSTKTQLLNGRASVRRSMASHREFSAEWVGDLNSGLESSLQTIKNYADGLYGDGPFYFLDPYILKQNVLPAHWAAPMLTAEDWPNLATDLVPSFVKDTVAADFPMKHASYDLPEGYESENKLVIIIPSGYSLHFGWHGPAASANSGVRIVPYKRADGLADAALNPAKIVAGGTTRTNTVISGATYSYVEIFLAADADQTTMITGMIAQVLLDGATVPDGGFIAGKGTTALEFEDAPKIEYYSSAINSGQVGMSASWIEV